MNMLQITDLHKRFGDKEVLRGLNLSVPEHSIFGFIGKNGSGKTTTMKTKRREEIKQVEEELKERGLK